jgi:glycosyltransferase involved in cell wall biosynthesis
MRQYRKLSRILVPSGFMRETLVDNGFERDRVGVTPLFSRYGVVRECIESHDHEDECLLFVGRLDRDKGVEQFIQALALLRDEKWEAVVVGDGPHRESACALAAELGIAQRIQFVGGATGEALADYYRACDMLVFSSMLHESFGLVGVEAMSFGKPVVAFRAGGVTEWLSHERTGLLCDHGDLTVLSRNIARLLADAPLRKRLGAAARLEVESRFTLDRHLDQLQEIYHRMQSEPRTMEVQECAPHPYPC